MKALNLFVMGVFALVLSYFLPIFADLVLIEQGASYRLRYSSVQEEFMLFKFDKIANKTEYEIIGKGTISEDEFIQNQPFAYASVLLPKGKFPAKFQLYADNPRLISQGSQTLNLRPSTNKIRALPLYAVLDVDPKFERVIFTPLFIRAGDEHGVQVIDINKNSVDAQVSSDLNLKLSAQGFKFPLKQHFSSPTVMKEFDEGAFVVDSADTIFHVKFKEGNFSVKNTGLAKPNIINIVVSENSRREFYALLVSQDELGLISYDNYKFIPLPREGYDPLISNLSLRIAPVFKSVMFSDEHQAHIHVMDLNYTIQKQNLSKFAPPTSLRYIKSYILPFETKFVQEGYYPKLKFSEFAPKSLILSILLAFGFFAYNLRFAKRKCVSESLFIAIFGIYGLIAVLFYMNNKGS